MAYRDALLEQLGRKPDVMTQGGTFDDPRWTDGTWGTGEPRNTGYSGIMNDPGGIQAPPLEVSDPTPAPTTPPAPDYTKLGQFAGGLKGYEMDKFNRPADQWSEKYKIGAVQSHFDPTKGITPEFTAALNSLGIGDFSGSGDKLTVANPRNGFRSAAGGTADVVQGLKSGNGNWTYWSDPALDAQGAGGVGQSAQPGGAAIAPMDVSGKTTMTDLNAYEPGAYLAALLAQLGVPA